MTATTNPPRRRADRARQVADILRREVLHASGPRRGAAVRGRRWWRTSASPATPSGRLSTCFAPRAWSTGCPASALSSYARTHPHGLDQLRGLAETLPRPGLGAQRGPRPQPHPRAPSRSRRGFASMPGDDVALPRAAPLVGRRAGLARPDLPRARPRRATARLRPADERRLRAARGDLRPRARARRSASWRRSAPTRTPRRSSGTTTGAPLLHARAAHPPRRRPPVDLEFIRFRGDRHLPPRESPTAT